MLNPLAGLILIFFWLMHEVITRRQLGLEPASLKALYKLSVKKGAADPRVPAAIFVLTVTFVFSFWESFLRFLLQKQPPVWFLLLGLVASGFALYFRKQSFVSTLEKGRVTRGDVWLLVLAWALLMGSGLSLILAPWIVWRTLYLPRRFQQYL